MYLGSVRFFKHLIIGTLILIIVLVSVLILNISHIIHYSNGAVRIGVVNNIAAKNDNSKLSMALSSTTVDASTSTTADASASTVASSIKKSYQLLFPDLYCIKSNETVVQDNTVYLTFDDGPSQQTLKILDILKENNIKATFFVVGKTDETSKRIMQQIVDEGHAIGVHSYTHIYEEVYRSVEAYLDDFYAMYNLIYEATGVKPNIFRFPGGSINSYNKGIYKDIIEEMNRRGFTYYDWNVSAVDMGGGATVKSIYNNVMTEVVNHSRSIVLFHDSGEKSHTVESLVKIIKDLKKDGYTFDSLSNKIKPIIFIK